MQPSDPCVMGERQLGGDHGSAGSSAVTQSYLGVHKEGKALVCLALGAVVKDAESLTGGTPSRELIKFFC